MKGAIAMVWPAVIEVVRMDDFERGDLLNRVRDRRQELDHLLSLPEYFEFHGVNSFQFNQDNMELMELDDLIEVIEKIGWDLPGSPSSLSVSASAGIDSND